MFSEVDTGVSSESREQIAFRYSVWGGGSVQTLLGTLSVDESYGQPMRVGRDPLEKNFPES